MTPKADPYHNATATVFTFGWADLPTTAGTYAGAEKKKKKKPKKKKKTKNKIKK